MGVNPYRDREGAAETRDGYPLAYLITCRCYGTWLHGDARGSVDREHNGPGTSLVAPNARLFARRTAMLRGEAWGPRAGSSCCCPADAMRREWSSRLGFARCQRAHQPCSCGCLGPMHAGASPERLEVVEYATVARDWLGVAVWSGLVSPWKHPLPVDPGEPGPCMPVCRTRPG